MRTGLVAKKIGMTRKFDDMGVHVPLTILKLEDVFVTSLMTEEKNGYNAVQIATKKAKVKNASQQMRGHFAKAKVEPQSVVREFRIDTNSADVDLGAQLSVSHFAPGQFIDVVGQSKGKGMAGVVKRWNFSTTNRVNNSKAHRIHGSTGACQDPGRVWKNKKMAGHMGDERVTVQNLVVYEIDEENQLIFVRGAVPGAKNSFVLIRDAKKKTAPKDLPLFGLMKDKNEKQTTEANQNIESQAAELEKSNNSSSDLPVEATVQKDNIDAPQPATETDKEV